MTAKQTTNPPALSIKAALELPNAIVILQEYEGGNQPFNVLDYLQKLKAWHDGLPGTLAKTKAALKEAKNG